MPIQKLNQLRREQSTHPTTRNSCRIVSVSLTMSPYATYNVMHHHRSALVEHFHLHQQGAPIQTPKRDLLNSSEAIGYLIQWMKIIDHVNPTDLYDDPLYLVHLHHAAHQWMVNSGVQPVLQPQNERITNAPSVKSLWITLLYMMSHVPNIMNSIWLVPQAYHMEILPLFSWKSWATTAKKYKMAF